LHLYNNPDVRTGTHDLLLNVYYGITLFGKIEKSFFQTPLQCLINKLHHIEKRARLHPTPYIPAFAIRCSGHQEGIATLLKHRAARTEKERKNGKDGKSQNKTRKISR
jgi:hypothetical protein